MDPIRNHSATIAKLAEKLGDMVVDTPQALEAAVTVDPSVAPSGERIEIPDAPAELTLEAPATQTAPPPKATDPAALRLKKSAEIQRRADEARKRSSDEARRLQVQKRKAEDTLRTAAAKVRDLETRERSIKDAEARLTEQIEQIKVDPFEFMRQIGVGPEKVAEYARQGGDPTRRLIERVQADAQKQIKAIEQKFEGALGEIKTAQLQRDEAVAQTNFFDYVEKAAKTAPGQFDAMQMVFSPEEQWQLAGTLADEADRLQLGWDADRLLEEVNNRAKKDPRWSRIKSRLSPKPAQSKPTEASPTSQSKTPPPESALRARREAVVTAPRDPAGQFRKSSPMERHANRVANLVKTTRL